MMSRASVSRTGASPTPNNAPVVTRRKLVDGRLKNSCLVASITAGSMNAAARTRGIAIVTNCNAFSVVVIASQRQQIGSTKPKTTGARPGAEQTGALPMRFTRAIVSRLT